MEFCALVWLFYVDFLLCEFVLLYLCDAQTFAKRNNVKLWWWTPSLFLYSPIVCICHHWISSQSRIIIHIPLKWKETIHNKRPRKSKENAYSFACYHSMICIWRYPQLAYLTTKGLNVYGLLLSLKFIPFFPW